MAVTIVKDVPIGGGLGNKKVSLIELKGTYATGGVALFKEEPTFMIASGGYGLIFDAESKKVKILSAGTELTADTSVDAIKIFVIY